jgi:hypothetical protein
MQENYKQIIICSVLSLLGMIAMATYTFNYTSDAINNKSFLARLGMTVSELDNLSKGKIKNLTFVKSVSVFGSVSNLKTDMHIEKDYCQYFSDTLKKSIVKNIEKRTALKKNEKEKFFQQYSLIQKQCRSKR